MEGRVVKITGLSFHVRLPDETILCSVRQSLKNAAEFELSPVVVGDVVEVIVDLNPPSEGAQRTGVITGVRPRRTLFFKKKASLKMEKTQLVAANIDQMIVVSSVLKPVFKMRLIDRFVITAIQGGMQPLVVINKVDLAHDVDLARIERIYSSAGIELIMTSATEQLGLERLRDKLKDRESVFVGQSGTGKTSLLNEVQPGLKLKTGSVSDKTGKGRHTTSVITLFPLDFGGYVVDTPGLRALGLTGLERSSAHRFYGEIADASARCRFSNCRHRDEPDCAVKEAVERGEIFRERYDSYIRILDEIA